MTIWRRRSTWSKFFLIVVSLLVTVLVAEGMSQLFYSIRWGGIYGLQPRHYSMRLGWEMASGSYVAFDINEQGFRRPNSVSLYPQEDTIRIFIVGGSTALGHQGAYPQFDPQPLSYEETIDYHLQTMLNTQHKGTQFEVINAGVTEYKLFQEFSLFREKLVNFHPHLVVFLDGHNDISSLVSGEAFKEHPTPYWENRHFQRGERALNTSSLLGPLYYLDIYLMKASYFYHGVSGIFHGIHNQAVYKVQDPAVEDRALSVGRGNDTFRLSDETRLMEKYRNRLRKVDQALSLYIDQVRDLKAIVSSRQIKVLYVLQPQLVVEEPSNLTSQEVQIQEFAFRHNSDFRILARRYLAPKVAASLENLSTSQFRFVNLVTIAEDETEQVYTDYCHLTSRGNLAVAEKLYPWVVDLVEVEHAMRAHK